MVARSIRIGRRGWRSKAALYLFAEAGSPPTMSDAVRIVVERLMNGISCPPTDLDAVSRKVNVVRCVEEDIAGSGELRSTDSGLTITYSTFLSPTRRRFTIAHEIAHAYFEDNWTDLARPGREVEQLCDMIAAEILMPTRPLSERIAEPLTMEAILQVARSFRVSLSAAAIRCSELKRTTVFEANNKSVTWARGVVRKGRIDRLNPEIQTVIWNALKGQAGQEELFLDSDIGLRPWHAEYCMTTPGHALLLLRPRSGALKVQSI